MCSRSTRLQLTFQQCSLATFLHYILILSPDGQYLRIIIENVNRLVPYGLVRQTLKVGNAATMINAMVKLVLAKLSVNTMTSWLGLTNPSDDGMNLLQSYVFEIIILIEVF